MKYQTNPGLGAYLNRWGCHICCILEKVEKRGKVKFSNEETFQIYQQGMAIWAIQREEMTSNGDPTDGCSVLNGKALFNLAAQSKGLSLKAMSYRYAPANYMPADNEEEILECERAGHPGVHFMSGTGKSNPERWQDEIEFDPIEGGSQTALYGHIKSKRILSF